MHIVLMDLKSKVRFYNMFKGKFSKFQVNS